MKISCQIVWLVETFLVVTNYFGIFLQTSTVILMLDFNVFILLNIKFCWFAFSFV